VSNASISLEQREALREAVAGRVVHDLGAGDLKLSSKVLQLGAAHVVAVDKEDCPRRVPHGITYRKCLFKDFLDPIDVALLSWPPNHGSYDLAKLVLRANRVVYIGKNTDGSVCGMPELFFSLIRRGILAYYPDRKNTLIVYGEHLPSPREPRGEEAAALSIVRGDPIWTYEQAERVSTRQPPAPAEF
jgi:hypothetical protein